MLRRVHSVPFLLVLAAFPACATAPADGVAFELGAAEFHGGDQVVIERVQSTTGDLAPGSFVTIHGSYRLASRDAATLYFGTTTNGPTSNAEPEKAARVTVARGSGSFTLQHLVPAPGHLHVTFYDQGSGQPFGGQYFGRGDNLLVSRKWAYAR